jgi:adenine-specific DNA-methyltransferase
MLHWANKDQYYIKTSEYLKDYAIRLRPDDAKNPMRVHFRLADVAEGEHGNAKAVAGKDRRFQLAGDDAISVENGELIIRFNYEPNELAQKVLNEAATKAVLGAQDSGLKEWVTALQQLTKRKDGTEGPSRLRMHLDRYTARNTFDYFIHKELGPFLKRELDFYIKNEVMHLDDIESSTAPRVEQYLSKLRAMRAVAHSIIAFLAQLEDFQKTLWLKKKFVVETSYCVRVGLLPEGMLAEVAGNDAQREEWLQVLHLNDLPELPLLQRQSAQFGVPFLNAHPSLMLDTRFFSADFTARMLASFSDLDLAVHGVIAHGDNFQSLALLQARYRQAVQTVYIDPPYNAKTSEILYKNTYKHSSWLSFMADRVGIARTMLGNDAVFVCAINENEQERLGALLGPILK